MTELNQIDTTVSGNQVSDKNTVTVEDMVSRIHLKIDEFSEEIDEEFVQELENQLKAKKNGAEYFISKNKYWDLWLQKLFAQLISIKVWILALITILLLTAVITNTQFITILGIVMGLKGAFSVAEVWQKKGSNNMIDKV